MFLDTHVDYLIIFHNDKIFGRKSKENLAKWKWINVPWYTYFMYI